MEHHKHLNGRSELVKLSVYVTIKTIDYGSFNRPTNVISIGYQFEIC